MGVPALGRHLARAEQCRPWRLFGHDQAVHVPEPGALDILLLIRGFGVERDGENALRTDVTLSIFCVYSRRSPRLSVKASCSSSVMAIFGKTSTPCLSSNWRHSLPSCGS